MAAAHPQNDVRRELGTKILVTGGAGYIGSTLVPMLLKEGYSVVIYDLFRWGIRPLLNPKIDMTNLEIVNGDILDDITLASVVKDCDVIIHLAGIVSAPAFNRYPEIAQEVNERGTQILADCLRSDQRMIYASVENVYGSASNECEGPCTEDTRCEPLSLFAKTKVNDENVVLGTGGVVLRIPSAFGVSPRMRVDLLVNNLVYQACTKGHIDLYQGNFKRNFIHVADLAQVFVFTVKNLDQMKGRAYNVGHESLVHSKRDICDVIKRHLPNVTVTEPDDEKYSDADKRNFVMSYERLGSLGVKIGRTLEEGVTELLRIIPFLSEEEIEKCQAL